jgi:hypothetical protein
MRTVCGRLLIDVRSGCGIWQHGREGCHVTHLGWNSQFCGEFSIPFTYLLLREFRIEIVKTFLYVLAFSGIFHEGYKSAHHPRASRYVKWPDFLIVRRMEFVEIWKYADRLFMDVLGK